MRRRVDDGVELFDVLVATVVAGLVDELTRWLQTLPGVGWMVADDVETRPLEVHVTLVKAA